MLTKIALGDVLLHPIIHGFVIYLFFYYYDSGSSFPETTIVFYLYDFYLALYYSINFLNKIF